MENLRRNGGNQLSDSLIIAVLFSLAVAHPLLELLQKNAQFFVARQSKPVDIFALALLLSIVIPVLLMVINYVLAKINDTLGRAFYNLLFLVLTALIVLPLLKKTEILPGWLLIALSFLISAVFLVAIRKVDNVKSTLAYLVLLILIIPTLFLMNKSILKILFDVTPPPPLVSTVHTTAPVIFVVLDELPLVSLLDSEEKIDSTRFPNFASLQKDSLWFRNATTVSDATPEAIASILAGKYPAEDRLPILRDYPNNLFTMLAGSYELKVLEHISNMSPKHVKVLGEKEKKLAVRWIELFRDLSVVYLHIVLPDEMKTNLPSISQTWGNFVEDRENPASDFRDFYGARREEFQAFLRLISPSPKPTLYFHHILLPHVPWSYLPSGKEYDYRAYGPMGVEGMGVRRKRWTNDDWVVYRGYQRHLLQVCFVDRMIGQLMDRLKKQNLYNASLIVITADHGMSFRAGDRVRSLSSTNYQDILPVPMLMKLPGSRNGKILDKNFETIDILPTIADALGIKIRFKTDGTSALADTPARPRKKVLKTIFSENRWLDYETEIEKRTDSVLRKIALFGTGNPEAIYAVPRFPELDGLSFPAEIPADTGEVIFELKNPEIFKYVNVDSNFIPVFIAGRALFQKAPEKEILLGVWINGTFRGVTRTFPQDQGLAPLLRRRLWLKPEEQDTISDMAEIHGFGIIVPESSFRQGRNEVKVVSLQGFIHAKTQTR